MRRDWSLTSIVAMTSAILTGDLSEQMMSSELGSLRISGNREG